MKMNEEPTLAPASLHADDPRLPVVGASIADGERRLLALLVRMQECVERLATLDPLTRLPNRQAFDERAQRLLSNAYAEGRVCAMLYIDLCLLYTSPSPRD